MHALQFKTVCYIVLLPTTYMSIRRGERLLGILFVEKEGGQEKKSKHHGYQQSPSGDNEILQRKLTGKNTAWMGRRLAEQVSGKYSQPNKLGSHAVTAKGRRWIRQSLG